MSKLLLGFPLKSHHDWGIYRFFGGGPDVPEANRSLGTGWGPPVISWFATPMNTIVISAIYTIDFSHLQGNWTLSWGPHPVCVLKLLKPTWSQVASISLKKHRVRLVIVQHRGELA